jgi:hypothetical protein
MAIIKQYVNLDPTKAEQLDGLDKARAGKNVVIEATIDPKKAGIAVRFEVTCGAKNVTRAGKTLNRVATTDDNGKATLLLPLSDNGGDEFTVNACLAEGENKNKLLGGTDTYVVWRRLYYQMSRFDAGTPGAGQPSGSMPAVPSLALDTVEVELAARNHNIELVDKSTKALITRYANVLTGANNSQAEMASARDGYSATLEPVTVRIVVVNQIAEPKEDDVELLGLAYSVKVLVPFPVGLWADPSYAKNADWLVTAMWRWGGSRAWKLIAPEHTKKVGVQEAEIDLAGAGVNCRDEAPDTKIDIRVEYRYKAGGSTGQSFSNVILLASSAMNLPARDETKTKQTAVHELGHLLGMVPVDQSTYYWGHGHGGPHCSKGLKDLTKSSYSKMSGKCVMYGEAGDTIPATFCEVCDPSLRKSPVTAAGLPTT